MEPPMITALIGGFFALVVLVGRRWFELSATRPKAAVAFLSKVEIGHSAIAGELGIKANAADVATFREHLWFWQAAKVRRMYNAILQEEQRSESYRQKVRDLHTYVSRFA